MMLRLYLKMIWEGVVFMAALVVLISLLLIVAVSIDAI